MLDINKETMYLLIVVRDHLQIYFNFLKCMNTHEPRDPQLCANPR